MHPLTRYRRSKGLTQTELAERLGVAMYTVQRWEKGTMPRPRALKKLAEVLEIDAGKLNDELYEWAEEEKDAA